MYQINIKGQNFTYRRLNSSVQGSVGVEQVTFSFDESWDGLAKWACFKNDNVPEIHVLLSDDNLTCDVPWEMYTKEGALYIGALGMQDGVVVKPTFWVQVSEVSEGVSTKGATPGEYTPSEIEQLTRTAVEASKKIGNLGDLETTAKQNLVAAINESLRSGGGGGNGEDGATFYPDVDVDGNLSWTNDKGLPNPNTVNIKGADGVDGYTPVKGVDYFDGKDGYTPIKGVDYTDGKNGVDGYTPQRGVDYWTPEDIAEIKSYVDDAILGGAW